MVIKGKKSIIVGLISVVLLAGGVLGLNIDNAYANSYSNCLCALTDVTVGYGGSSFSTGDQENNFVGSDTEFVITSLNPAITEDPNTYRHNAEESYESIHPVSVYYSFDNTTYTDLFVYKNGQSIPDHSIDIEGEDDLYLKFVLLDQGTGETETDRKMHFTTEPLSIVTSITAKPSELSSKGGNVKINVVGTNLPANLGVKAYGSDNNDPDITASSYDNGSKNAMDVTETGGTFSMDFPANNTDTNKTYIITAVQNGDPFGPTTKVTVLAKSDSDINNNDKNSNESDNNINDDSKKKVEPAGSKTADESDFIVPIAIGMIALLGLFLTLWFTVFRKNKSVKEV